MQRWGGTITRLRIAGFTSAFGNGATGVALPLVLALTFTGWQVGVVLAALGLGMMYSFARGGVEADRSHRVHQMIFFDVLRAIATAAIAAATLLPTSTGWMPAAVCALINGVSVGFYRPALGAYWTDVLDPETRRAGLASNALINRTGLAIGAATAGLFVAAHISVWVLVLDAVTFAFGALICIGLPEVAERSDQKMMDLRLFRIRRTKEFDLLANWRTIYTTLATYPWLRAVISTSIMSSLFLSICQVAAPLVLVERYSGTEIALIQSLPVVLLFAGNLAARIGDPPMPGAWLATSLITKPLSYIAIGLHLPAPVPAALASASSFTDAVNGPRLANTIAEGFPSAERGKVFGAQQGSGSLLSPVGLLVAGLATTLTRPEVLLFVAAAALAVLALVPCFRSGFLHFRITTSPTPAPAPVAQPANS
ncbi:MULTISPECIES: MFS transporter [Nocardia]|jgi:MFS family permease|uniref:MFS transporter n=1 Tax=Nocardia abscessus TaxID=120957 RepID=UPI0018938B9C|nr:MFS transporter [Nocardia abscessus]MBF6475466.1 MFS transporter [Nocardia abscessus]